MGSCPKSDSFDGVHNNGNNSLFRSKDSTDPILNTDGRGVNASANANSGRGLSQLILGSRPKVDIMVEDNGLFCIDILINTNENISLFKWYV